MSALVAADIRVAFGGVLACDGVSLRAESGQAVGLTGPNGSGKSTFLNALTGLVAASGSLRIHGAPMPLGRPRLVRRRGVARAFQAPQNVAALTALENVALGSTDRRACGLGAALIGRRTMLRVEEGRWAAAHAAIERVGLGAVAQSSAGSLTYGQQRLLELARAIVAEPAILMLDEPSAGLNAAETAHLATLLADLRDSGMALLVVDHKVDFLDTLCQRIVVMQLGTVIADGRPGSVWREQSVIDAYLGRADGEP